MSAVRGSSINNSSNSNNHSNQVLFPVSFVHETNAIIYNIFDEGSGLQNIAKHCKTKFCVSSQELLHTHYKQEWRDFVNPRAHHLVLQAYLSNT